MKNPLILVETKRNKAEQTNFTWNFDAA